jgi:hypothetical protein
MKLLLEISKEDLDIIDDLTQIERNKITNFNPDFTNVSCPYTRLAIIRKSLGLNMNVGMHGIIGGGIK